MSSNSNQICIMKWQVCVVVSLVIVLGNTFAQKFVTKSTPRPTTRIPGFLHIDHIEEEKEYGAPNASFLPLLETHLFDPDSESVHYYYDAAVRPNIFSALDVYAEFFLFDVARVDEKKGVIVPSGILIVDWMDNRLTWDPEQFGNITYTTFENYKIWQPRFITNGDNFLPQVDSLAKADVYHTGEVSMTINIHEETPCAFDMTDFPRDTQTCHIHLYHPDHQVHLHASPSSEFDDAELTETEGGTHGETSHIGWEVLSVEMNAATEEAGQEKLDLFSVTLKIKRHASFFLRIYVTPICFLLLLIPVIFLLPPDSTEKLTYGAILLFCMIYVSQTIEAIYPPYTDSTPYLIQLTTASGALLFLCILLTSLISSAERLGRKRPLPLWIKGYIVGVVGPFLLVKENADPLSEGTVHIRPTGESDKDYIVESEHGIDFSEDHNGGLSGGETSHVSSDTNQILQSLVNELKQTRLQSKAYDDWTNLFTILNRALFLLTLLIGIIIILCFA